MAQKRKNAASSRKKKQSNARGNSKTNQRNNGTRNRSTERTKREEPVIRQSLNGEPKKNPGMMLEFLFWFGMGVAAILLIGLCGFGGATGRLERQFLFGTFGIMAYSIPFVIGLILLFFSWKNFKDPSCHVGVKTCSTLVLLCCLCGFTKLFVETPTSHLYRYCAAVGGSCGALGYYIGAFLQRYFGTIGAGIILVIGMIVCLAAMTDISFMKCFLKMGRGMVLTGVDYRNTVRDRRDARRSEDMEDEEEPENERPNHRFLSDREHPETFPNKPIIGSYDNRFYEKNQKHRYPDQYPEEEALPFEEEEEMPVPKKRERTVNVEADLRSGNAKKKRPGRQEVSRMRGSERRAMRDREMEFPPKEDQKAEVVKRKTAEHAKRSGKKTILRNLPEEENFSDDFSDLTGSSLMTMTMENEAVTEENLKKRKQRSTVASRQEAQQEANKVASQVRRSEKEKPAEENYKFPPMQLLAAPSGNNKTVSKREINETIDVLQQTLDSFGIGAKVIDCSCGPTVTRYELQPDQGVKVSKIVGIQDDIKLALAATDIRMEAPIPGKSAIGIEVPNANNSMVAFREMLESREFTEHKSKIAVAVGKDLAGKPVVSDIAKMPHLLIAGATGSGKSVCINTIIMSILYKARPSEVKMIMIDPKVVELSVYNGIPHLLIPVVTDPKKAAGALNWGVAEMMKRYEKFAEMDVRDLAGYNRKAEQIRESTPDAEDLPEILPQIVIIVDELADLMMVAPGEVEDAICRLAQLARAAGMHLIIATQRPSVKVITGLIKANMPSRIAFSVTSFVDSKTILDKGGAEKLLGKGDMLFLPQGYSKPARVQGCFVSDDEVHKVVTYLKENHDSVEYNTEIQDKVNQNAAVSVKGKNGNMGAGAEPAGDDDLDEYYEDSAKLIVGKEKASIGMLQRAFKIGFNRAARIMEQLEKDNIVSAEDGTKPRKVLMSQEQLEEFLAEKQR